MAELRATTTDGSTVDDPTEDGLLLLVQALQQEQDHLVLERLADPTGHTYAQVARCDGAYLVERRHGTPESHEHAFTSDPRVAHDVLTAWAFGARRPDPLSWAPGLG